MKKILKFLGVILLLVLLYCGIAILAFDKAYHYEKSVVIDAPVEKVWQHSNSLRAYNAWDPFSKEDREMKIEYSGNSGEIGDSYHWTGKESGEGTQTVSKLVPNQLMETDLHFIKPFESNAKSRFSLTPENGKTKMTWAMDFEMEPLMKPMKPFMDMNMKKMFEKGLQNLKNIAEK
ncbi:hypothetical protein ASG01_12885 [Chryseobacterium sp. Leaf180]|uniref:SRPBCC family protein n=1 Tax=Chryseobacterium sp. Leaf180 TaxID=1736289 RepID=UPI0006F72D50|nr:SRPBCC family protein [Chryseobacterium sp. Leaf180]KQR91894.1 hypothetical protein ASG01_12885 [Chryseobacterium sp. Leaf180]